MYDPKQKIRGMACVVLKRCSSPAQVGTSIANQGMTTEQCVKECELEVVLEKSLEGVTGSIPFLRTDIDEIINRKKLRNDFKVLIVQDATRFTRAGGGHGMKLVYDLRSVGILVYFLAENILVDTPMAEQYLSFLFNAANEAVRRISAGATAGTTRSFLDGRSPHCRVPPYGLDRMYSENGVDLHVIRNLPDGTQQQWSPDGTELKRTFGRNEKKGIPNHYIKQKSEQVRLWPGEVQRVANVYLMFVLHDLQHQSPHDITKHFNDLGIPSPKGKEEWHTKTVRDLLNNPIYLGLGIRHRNKGGIYHNGTDGMPVPSEVDIEELANHAHVKQRRRKRSEWLEKRQPDLIEFLPAEMRELAKVRIENYLASIADAKPKGSRDRHRRSIYLLKGILRSKQGNYAMTGRRGGKDNEVRHYCVSRGETAPKTNNVLRHRIQAEPIEQAVIEVLRQTTLNRPCLVDAMKQVAARHKQHLVVGDDVDAEDLRKELKKKRRQLVLLSDGVDVDGEDDVLARKVTAIKREINEIERRIEQVDGKAPAMSDPSKTIEKLSKQIYQFGQKIDPADVLGIRNLLSVLISRLEVDLETKHTHIEFSIPSWMDEVLLAPVQVGLEELSAYRPSIEAHPENGVILANFTCDADAKPLCFTCRRTGKAA